MTASATAPTREKAERARQDCEYVRSLLNARQPQFAAALELAARKLVRDHGTVCASSQRSSQPGWGLLTVRRGPAPDGDAVVTMPAGTFYSLLTGQVTVAGAVRHATVDGEPGIARRALEPLAAAGSRPAM